RETLAQQGVDELTQKEKQLKEASWKLRLQQATGQLENPSRLKVLRRDIARVKTFRRALELAERGAKGRRKRKRSSGAGGPRSDGSAPRRRTSPSWSRSSGASRSRGTSARSGAPAGSWPTTRKTPRRRATASGSRRPGRCRRGSAGS